MRPHAPSLISKSRVLHRLFVHVFPFEQLDRKLQVRVKYDFMPMSFCFVEKRKTNERIGMSVIALQWEELAYTHDFFKPRDFITVFLKENSQMLEHRAMFYKTLLDA